MKKLLFFIAIASTAPCALQAISKSDISQELTGAINTLNLNALDRQVSIAGQQKVVAQWDSAVNKAKQFVMEKSKDLLRKEDPDLTGNMKKLEGINNDFSNTIKIIRGAGAQAPISRLLGISAEAQKIASQTRAKSFTLPGKKDAQALIAHIAECIASSTKYLYGELVGKK